MLFQYRCVAVLSYQQFSDKMQIMKTMGHFSDCKSEGRVYLSLFYLSMD